MLARLFSCCVRQPKNARLKEEPLTVVDSGKNDYIKVVVVGASNAGKTSLIDAYDTGDFYDGYKATREVNFRHLECGLPESKTHMQIWDTDGSSANNIGNYLRGADVVIVAYDLSDANSPNLVRRQIELLNHYHRIGFKIILAGTKLDLSGHDNTGIMSIKDISDANSELIVGCTQTSARNGENVKDLFDKLVLNANKDKRHVIPLIIDESENKKSLVGMLRLYLERVGQAANHSDRFYFFRQRRAMNAALNYSLATSLLTGLNDDQNSIQDVLSANNYQHTVRSCELNKILKTARGLALDNSASSDNQARSYDLY